MKRVFVSLALLSFTVAALANSFGAHGHGVIPVSTTTRGFFHFAVRQHGEMVRGRLAFVERSPNSVVAVATVLLPHVTHAVLHNVVFGGLGVVFRGPGTLNGHPVIVEARAVDSGHHDSFNVRCLNDHGVVVYEAGGPLLRGGIEIVSFK